MTHYDNTFYDNQMDGSLVSAQRVVPLVYALYEPELVIDIGCGVGTWASVFEEHGAAAVGVDGDYVSRDKLLIENFISADLFKPLRVRGKFDLVVCLEVAEHLPEKRSDSFIRDLTKLADRVLFSAATPGQGGTNHINEQPLEFWEGIFNKYGYVMKDVIRPEIAEKDGIDWWYKKNIVVFEKE